MQNHKISIALFLALSSVYLQTASADSKLNSNVPASKPAQNAHQPTLAGKANFIAEFDQDGDEQVSQTEFKQLRQQRYQQMDQQQNQQVTASDYQSEYADRLDRKLNQERQSQIQQTHTRVKALDKDQDGAISQAEYQGSGERAFAYLDTNNDLQINALDPAPAARSERPTATDASDAQTSAPNSAQASARTNVRPNSVLKMPTSHNLAGMLEIYDQNQDGSVTKDEYLAQRQMAFQRTDSNNDGILSADEYLNEFVDRLDRQVATVRASQLKQALVRFKALDKDEDSFLSQAEYDASGARMFKRWDTSGDALVTMAEPLPKAEIPTTPPANANASAKTDIALQANSTATGDKSTQDVAVKTN